MTITAKLAEALQKFLALDESFMADESLVQEIANEGGADAVMARAVLSARTALAEYEAAKGAPVGECCGYCCPACGRCYTCHDQALTCLSRRVATLRQQGGRVDEITDEDRPATRTAAMTYTAKGVREAAAGLTYTLDGDGVYSAMLRSFADMLEAQEGGTDALDAKRYRWLRDAGPDNIEVYFATTSNPSGWGDWDGWTDKDAAIDAAMAEGGEG